MAQMIGIIDCIDDDELRRQSLSINAADCGASRFWSGLISGFIRSRAASFNAKRTIKQGWLPKRHVDPFDLTERLADLLLACELD
ncbi:hypothetical protein ACVIWU_006471 [Bradyrhizobium sp. USDA 4509]